MAHFQDLLQDAEQMTAQIDKENSDMPRLQRTFSQLFDTNRRKLSKTTNLLASDSNEINASILLAAKGIDELINVVLLFKKLIKSYYLFRLNRYNESNGSQSSCNALMVLIKTHNKI
jgi:hypothetical protein